MRVQTEERTRPNDVVTLLRQYEEEHKVVAEQRRNYAVKALMSFWEGKDVSDINIPSCRQYVAHRMGSGVAMSTIARELTCLRAACNHAYRWERLDVVPRFEIPADLPKRDVWLFKDELRAIIKAADPVMELFIRLAYGTASRKRAIETLQWEQVNFARKVINLSKNGEKQTTKRRPVVPIGDLYPVLARKHLLMENEWVLGSDKNIRHDFERVCKKAGLSRVEQRDGRPEGKVTPHVLRHTRATHLLEDGASIFAVAKLLGDTPTTVQSVYGHICMSSLEDELNKSKGVL